jgi:hypothetical protein
MDHQTVRAFLADVEAERDRYATLATSIRAILDGEVVAVVAPPIASSSVPKRGPRPPLPAKVAPKQFMRQSKPIKSPSSARAGDRVIDRTIAALTKRGRPMSVVEIAREIGHSAGTLQQCLTAYVKRGLIAHTGRAEFGLPEHAKGNGKAAPTPAPEFSIYHHVEKHGRGWLCTRCDEVRAEINDFDGFTCGAGS